jgi:serine/threonine protein kinase
MPFVPAIGAEPITGYQLVERLGTGGYGAVWKTTAPGGLTKAMKIVFGDLEGHQAEQELKALRRIKEVRHPFLLSLERFEIVDGQLFIITELADRSLLDRYLECRQADQRGIPRAELLGYLRDAAEALDYMGDTHGLQHLDIKPQNLLLVGGRIKVADFGLVKDLVGTSVTATGGVTPIYATPEAFDGRVSRYSDQYSLAVVYQEMLTGVRPFPGTTVLQLAAQHMSGRPLLDPLPASDRPVIAKALSKVPEGRFSTCRELVESLLRVRGAPSAPPAVLAETVPDVAPVQTPSEGKIPPDEENEDALGLPTEIGLTPLPKAHERRTPPPKAAEIHADLSLSPWRISPAITDAKIALRPTLFLGVGGLACSVLKRLRQRLHRRFGRLDAAPILRLLLIDTDRAELRRARHGEPGEALALEETLLAPLHPVEHYRDESKEILRWLERRWLYGIPRSKLTEGIRPLGYLALVDNATEIKTRVKDLLARITSAEAKAATASATGLSLRDDSPRVFLISSISGGTGSGMLLGLAYAVRQALGELYLSGDGLCGILLHATSPKPSEKELAQANTLATLQELRHFSRRNAPYPGDPDKGLAAFGPEQQPLEDTYLVTLGDQLSKSEADAATDAVAEYLHLDAAGPHGTFLDEYRRLSRGAPTGSEDELPLRSLGLFRMSFPRPRLVKLATNLFCRRVVERWPGKPGDLLPESLDREAERKAKEIGIDEESFIKQMHHAEETVLGEDPEVYFPRLVAEASPDLNVPHPPSASEVAERIFSVIDKVLGSGPSSKDKVIPPLTPFELALRQQAEGLGAELSTAIVDWLLTIVDDPRRRLRSADHAAARLVQHLLEVTESVKSKLAQLQAYRDALRQRLLSGKTSGKATMIRWLPAHRRPPAPGKSNHKFVDYCWARLGEIALQNTLTIFASDQQGTYPFTQDLVLCRQRLNQFAALFAHDPEIMRMRSARPLPIPSVIELLPGKASDLDAAAAAVVDQLPPEVFRQFDENFQEEVLNQQGGLWGMVSSTGERDLRASRRGPSSLAFWDMISLKNDVALAIKEKLQARARPIVLSALKDLNAARLFLDASREVGQAELSLLEHVENARPRLFGPGGWLHLVMALPNNPDSAVLREIVTRRLAELPLTILDSEDDVILSFEAANLPVRSLMEALTVNDPSAAEMAKKVLTRVDVSWTFLTPEDAVKR